MKTFAHISSSSKIIWKSEHFGSWQSEAGRDSLSNCVHHLIVWIHEKACQPSGTAKGERQRIPSKDIERVIRAGELRCLAGHLQAVLAVFPRQSRDSVNQSAKRISKSQNEWVPRQQSALTGQSTTRGDAKRAALRTVNRTGQPKFKSVPHSCRQSASYSFSSCFLTY